MMKSLKLMLFSVALLSTAAAFAKRNCGSCRSSCAEEVSENCAPKPCCKKTIEVNVPVRKVCNTYCHYVCDDPDAKVVGYEDGSKAEEGKETYTQEGRSRTSGRKARRNY